MCGDVYGFEGVGMEGLWDKKCCNDDNGHGKMVKIQKYDQRPFLNAPKITLLLAIHHKKQENVEYLNRKN